VLEGDVPINWPSGNITAASHPTESVLVAYGRRVLRRLIAILTFSRRTECLTGRAKVIDGDTIVVADQLVRLRGIDAPNRIKRSSGVANRSCAVQCLWPRWKPSSPE
jgi:endonuclease YncB( thermonuclease family)